MKPASIGLPLVLLLASVATSVGCQSSLFSNAEALGVAKRGILADGVASTRDQETQAKKDFKNALKVLGELTSNPKSDDLFDKYSKFKRAYDDCEYRVNELADSIENIEDVSRNMFDEWTDQLAEYTNQDLRRASETQRADTQRSYDVLIAATKSAERAIKPVHATFHDQVLFLKGNVNAEAIVTLQGQTAAVDADVAKLVVDLDAAIAAAEKFLEGMPKR